jgi:hypothetical protein
VFTLYLASGLLSKHIVQAMNENELLFTTKFLSVSRHNFASPRNKFLIDSEKGTEDKQPLNRTSSRTKACVCLALEGILSY